MASGVKQDCGRMHLRMNAITINWFGAYFDIFGGLKRRNSAYIVHCAFNFRAPLSAHEHLSLSGLLL